jgi:hypothetical protein
MVAWPRGGANASLDDYIAEMRDAMGRGIDGFALNCGGWSVNEPQYKERVLLMYQAAERFAGDFRLFVSVDGHAQDELDDIVRTTRGLTAQLMQDGMPVLSAYALGGRSAERCAELMKQAHALGVWFIPHVSPSSGEAVIGPKQAIEIANRIELAKGYFFFGAAASPDSLSRSILLLSSVLKRVGKTFMASVTPYYRGLAAGTNYRAFETNGFSGMAQEWRAAIDSGAAWVQIVTWNDWAESTYVAPIGSASHAYVFNKRFGALLNHTGYLDASRYYIKWFKSGIKPLIKEDEVFYFYRLHPVDQTTTLFQSVTDRAAFPPRTTAPMTTHIHLTAFLVESATLEVVSGASCSVVTLERGVNEVAVPWTPGRPRFSLVRNGTVILEAIGEEPITRNDYNGAFNYFSGTLRARNP